MLENQNVGTSVPSQSPIPVQEGFDINAFRQQFQSNLRQNAEQIGWNPPENFGKESQFNQNPQPDFNQPNPLQGNPQYGNQAVQNPVEQFEDLPTFPTQESPADRNFALLRQKLQEKDTELATFQSRVKELEEKNGRYTSNLGDDGLQFAEDVWKVFTDPYFDKPNEDGQVGPERFFLTLQQASPKRAENILYWVADTYGPELVKRVLGEDFSPEDIQAFKDFNSIPRLKHPSEMEFQSPEEEEEYTSKFLEVDQELDKFKKFTQSQQEKAKLREQQEFLRYVKDTEDKYKYERHQVAFNKLKDSPLAIKETDSTDVKEQKEELASLIGTLIEQRIYNNPQMATQYQYGLEMLLGNEPYLYRKYASSVDEFISKELDKIVKSLTPVFSLWLNPDIPQINATNNLRTNAVGNSIGGFPLPTNPVNQTPVNPNDPNYRNSLRDRVDELQRQGKFSY